MRIQHSSLVIVALVVAACETTASPSAPAAPSTASAAVASASGAPSASASVAASASAPKSACLMTHICSCNMGCAKIAVDPATLRDGMHATAQSGTYAGKDMIIMKDTDVSGASVFTLSDRERNYPCQVTPESKSLMAFACAAKDSGPVPANACAKGCD